MKNKHCYLLSILIIVIFIMSIKGFVLGFHAVVFIVFCWFFLSIDRIHALEFQTIIVLTALYIIQLYYVQYMQYYTETIYYSLYIYMDARILINMTCYDLTLSLFDVITV